MEAGGPCRLCAAPGQAHLAAGSALRRGRLASRAGCTAGAWFILRHTGEPAKSAVPFPEGLTLLSAVQCPPPRL